MHSSYLTPPASNEAGEKDQYFYDTSVKIPTITTEERARQALRQALEGSTILDSYSIVKVIGFGANGVVLAAETINYLGSVEQVAVKLIYKAPASVYRPAPTNNDKIPSEIKILRAMATEPHPGLLRYINDFQDEKNFYLVTELFGTDWIEPTYKIQNSEGHYANNETQTLAPLLYYSQLWGPSSLPFSSGASDCWGWAYYESCIAWAKKTPKNSPAKLPIRVIKTIVYKVLIAMIHLHERLGMFHCDIKLENILVSRASNSDEPIDDYNVNIRVCDFGHSDFLIHGMKHIGTEGNAAPELVASKGRVAVDGAKADVYAMGAMIEKLVEARDAAKEDDFDLFLRDLLDGMMADDPQQRMSMREAAEHFWFMH
ncbi:hypothetical protein HDU99_003355 [Rhizoclosmatium hyalinum]|nr:hypothetical protein HDU99_003355 [Rhizoclosmatium hyalinum]